MVRLDQSALAAACSVSIPTIKRLEAGAGPLKTTYETAICLQRTLEGAGIEFIDDRDAPGVRYRPKIMGVPESDLIKR